MCIFIERKQRLKTAGDSMMKFWILAPYLGAESVPNTRLCFINTIIIFHSGHGMDVVHGMLRFQGRDTVFWCQAIC